MALWRHFSPLLLSDLLKFHSSVKFHSPPPAQARWGGLGLNSRAPPRWSAPRASILEIKTFPWIQMATKRTFKDCQRKSGDMHQWMTFSLRQCKQGILRKVMRCGQQLNTNQACDKNSGQPGPRPPVGYLQTSITLRATATLHAAPHEYGLLMHCFGEGVIPGHWFSAMSLFTVRIPCEGGWHLLYTVRGF